MIRKCFFINSISDELGNWCKDRNIRGRIFERFDGGGHNGYLIEFEDNDIHDRVAAEFCKEASSCQYLLGEDINFLGWL